MEFLIKFFAQYVYLIIVLGGLIAFMMSLNKIKLNYFKVSLLTLPLSFVMGKITNLLIKDPRPFIVLHIQPLIHSSADNGFPSDHTLLTMTVALIIFIYHKKTGLLLGLLSICVGVARVLAFVHHPLDIIGSIVISIFATTASWYLLKRIKFIK